MATLRLILGTDPRALLEAAADAFLTPAAPAGPFPTPPYLLALRQGGLRDDLLGLAAERGVPGWFDPPLCLFQQLPEWLGATDRVPCGDYERVVLLTRLLRESAPAVFARLSRPDAFADAVDRLFGELVAEGVQPDALDAAFATCTDRDAFEAARDADLAACYRGYLDALARIDARDGKRRRDGRDRLLDCAEAVLRDPDALARRLGGRREIRFFGLQDLRGGWRALLRALRESPALDRVVIYSTAALATFEGLQPDACGWVGRQAGLAVRLFGEGVPAIATVAEVSADSPDLPADSPDLSADGPRVRVVSAPDADREAEDVAHRVRTLIDGGADPARIAVVARSARPYVDRILDALAKYGVPATARRRHRFAEIPVVRALLSLFSVAADGWTRHGLVELAEQPYFGRHSRGTADAALRRLDPVIINHIGYRRQVSGLGGWVAAHEELYDRAKAAEAKILEGEEERWGRDAPPPSVRVGEAKTFFERFAEQAREIERTRPLREWVDWLHGFLESDPWQIERHIFHVPEDRYDVARLDAAGFAGVRGIVRQWHDALDAWGGGEEVLSVAAFDSRLREMLSGDAALWTPTGRAVQVSEGLAAAQRAFDHVFIVGLAGSSFPLRSPRSPLLDESGRVRLAATGLQLDLAGTWEQRERELFRVLVAGAEASLTLTVPRADGQGRELATSVFVEDVAIALVGEARWEAVLKAADKGELTVEASPQLTYEVLKGSDVVAPTLPLVADADARGHAVHAAYIERDRRSGLLSPYNGLVELPDLRDRVAAELGEAKVWSPTQLEQYAKCPWAWFSQRLLRLEHLSDPEIDIDPIARGTILHDAMRRFYVTAGVRERGPVFLRAADRAWAMPLLGQVLDEAIAEAGPSVWLGAPALRLTKRDELQRMLARYLDWEIEHNEQMYNNRKKREPLILRTGVVEHELAFGMPDDPDSHPEMTIERAGVRFRLRGSVDRVEQGVDERLDPEEAGRFIAAVDYKTSKWSAPGGDKAEAWDDGVVLQVPLYAHVLEKLQPGSRVSRVEYRAFRHREVLHSLELYRVNKKTHELTQEPDAAARMGRALDDAARHVERARAAEFPAHPAPSCACPPFCHALDICRVAMGPRGGREADSEWTRMAAAIRGGEQGRGASVHEPQPSGEEAP